MFEVSKRKMAFIAMAVGLSVNPAFAGNLYKSDQGHTEVLFGWAHAGGVSIQHGEFTSSSIEITLDQDAPENTVVNATINTDSLSSGYAALDRHLKSRDFLEVATYPTMEFSSTSVKRTGETPQTLVATLRSMA